MILSDPTEKFIGIDRIGGAARKVGAPFAQKPEESSQFAFQSEWGICHRTLLGKDARASRVDARHSR
jgi:hypothetical protein